MLGLELILRQSALFVKRFSQEKIRWEKGGKLGKRERRPAGGAPCGGLAKARRLCYTIINIRVKEDE